MLRGVSSGGGGTSFTGSIAATQVAFGSGANAFAGDANFTYNSGTGVLSLSNGATGGMVFGAISSSGGITSSDSRIAIRQGGLGVYVFNDSKIGFGTSIGVFQTAFSQISAGNMALGNGTAGDFSSSLKLSTLTATAAAPTVAAAQIGYGSTTAATATAGAGGALPVTVQAYIIVNVAGTNFKIPYFAV